MGGGRDRGSGADGVDVAVDFKALNWAFRSSRREKDDEGRMLETGLEGNGVGKGRPLPIELIEDTESRVLMLVAVLVRGIGGSGGTPPLGRGRERELGEGDKFGGLMETGEVDKWVDDVGRPEEKDDIGREPETGKDDVGRPVTGGGRGD